VGGGRKILNLCVTLLTPNLNHGRQARDEESHEVLDEAQTRGPQGRQEEVGHEEEARDNREAIEVITVFSSSLFRCLPIVAQRSYLDIDVLFAIVSMFRGENSNVWSHCIETILPLRLDEGFADR